MGKSNDFRGVCRTEDIVGIERIYKSFLVSRCRTVEITWSVYRRKHERK